MPVPFATKTEIVNNALVLLGEKQIGHIDTESSDVAGTMRLLWPQVLREVFTAFDWRELIREQTLPDSSGQTDLAEDYKFRLPGDFLKMLATSIDGIYRWKISGNYLLYSQDTAPIVRYLRYEEEPSDWSVELVSVVTHLLAVRACLAITHNVQLKEQLVNDYERALTRARLSQSESNASDYYRERKTSWITARETGFLDWQGRFQ
jgi:hypothetical protein